MRTFERVTDPEWAKGTWEWHDFPGDESRGEWSPVQVPWGIAEVGSLVLIATIVICSALFQLLGSPSWLACGIHGQGALLMMFLFLGCMGKRSYRSRYGEIPEDRFQPLLLLTVVGGGALWAVLSGMLNWLIGLPLPS